MWFTFPHAVLVLIATLASSVTAESFAGSAIYSGSECPVIVSVIDSTECKPAACLFFIADAVTYSSVTTCESSDRETSIANAFAGSSYVAVETFTKACTLFMGTHAFSASNKCLISDDQGDNYFIATVSDNGSASVGIYNDSSCTGTPLLGYTPDAETVSSRSCYMNRSVIYTGGASTDDQFAASTGLSVTDSLDSTSSSYNTRMSSNTGSLLDGSVADNVGPTDGGSEAGGNATVLSETSEGINTGALIGILVAYVMLSVAACTLCMDRIGRIAPSFGLRR